MSAIEIIEEWERLGLNWMYVWSPKLATVTIPAKGQVQLPYEGYVYKYPEGVSCQFRAFFDHPACGIRAQADPSFDSEESFTVTNGLNAGMTVPEFISYVRVPPDSPYYLLHLVSFWRWKNWLRLYLINTDSVPHRCLAYAYTIIVLTEPRKEEK